MFVFSFYFYQHDISYKNRTFNAANGGKRSELEKKMGEKKQEVVWKFTVQIWKINFIIDCTRSFRSNMFVNRHSSANPIESLHALFSLSWLLNLSKKALMSLDVSAKCTWKNCCASTRLLINFHVSFSAPTAATTRGYFKQCNLNTTYLFQWEQTDALVLYTLGDII